MTLSEYDTLIMAVCWSVIAYCLTGAVWHMSDVFSEWANRINKKGFYRDT